MKIIYERIIRHKFLTLNCKSIDDMIDTFENYIHMLKTFKNNNITLDPNSVEDDYNRFITEDPIVAAKFNMETVPENESA